MIGDPNLATRIRSELRLPVFAGPMFIGSTADLVIAQCQAGIVGSMPALNPRSTAALDSDIAKIKEAVGDAPYAINLVGHKSNDRLDADYAVLEKYKVPIVVLALAANADLVNAVHNYGGLVFNDIIKNRHAQKCAEFGVDGLIAVSAGAGGHTGNLSPFALVQEIREWWQGPICLGGAIATGRQVLAAEIMGADFGYIGSPFLACDEANTSREQKQMIVDSSSADVLVSKSFTGVDAAFMRPSIIANGLDPDNLKRDPSMEINIKDGGANAKAWRDIWSAGQGIGAIKKIQPAKDYIDAVAGQYFSARADALKMLSA
ncbi:MAG: nitronate monooxygenase family protein [Caulobacterales bacterium]